MRVPLNRYPDMLSAVHVGQILGCSASQAKRIMMQMEHVDISTGSGKQQSLRVSKIDLIQRFGLVATPYLAKAR